MGRYACGFCGRWYGSSPEEVQEHVENECEAARAHAAENPGDDLSKGPGRGSQHAVCAEAEVDSHSLIARSGGGAASDFGEDEP